MALTKVLRGGLNTGIADSSDATAITIDSSENVMMGGATSATSDITVGTASTDKRGIFIGSNQYRLGLKNASNNEVWLGSNGANSFTVSNASGSTLINVDSSGNIVLPTSSAGIYLGVTSATSANLLDDYEEGTFSPVFQTGGNSNGIGHSISSGTYTKVGNRVMCNGFAAMNSKDSSSLTGGNVTIGGLPFTIYNDNNSYSAAALRIQNISFADQCSLATVVNSTTLDFREITNSGSVTTLTDGNITSTSYVIFEIAYRVN